MRAAQMSMLILGLLCFALRADIAVSGVAAVEFTKKCQDATKGNLDASWIRAEPKLTGTLQGTGLTGLIHLRLQPEFASKVSDNKYNLQARQVYFKLPVSIIDLLVGRWYEIYGATYPYYFGRYLVEKQVISGTGSMNTNYTILDGMKLTLNINAIKCAVQIGLLPQDLKFENDRIMAMFGGSPVEGFRFNIGGNFEAIYPDSMSRDPVHRFMVNCAYTIIKELNLGLFGEYTIVDLNEASDNSWFLIGFSTKAGPVLDRIQVECEIKNHRMDDPTTDNNLAWMFLLQKKVLGLTLDLNVGADPTILGSKKIGDVGVIFRTTASF